jgi:ATP-binding cassette subfamily B multidrug efflux pump
MTSNDQALAPGSAECPSSRTAAWRRLLALLRPEASRLGGVAVACLVGVCAALAGPWLLGTAIDRSFHPGTIAEGRSKPQGSLDHTALARTLAVVALLYVVSAVCAWAEEYLMARVAQRTAYTLREEIAGKLTRLPVAHFDTHSRGDLLSRMTNDVDNVTTALHEGVVELIAATLGLVGAFALMVSISPWLTLLTCLVLPLAFVSTALVTRRAQNRFALWSQRTGDLNGHAEEVFSGLDVVAVHGQREAMIDSFDELNDRLYSAGVRAHVISGILQPVTMLLQHLNYVVIAVAGALYMASGQLSLGEVQAFVQYTWLFTAPLVDVADTVDILQCGLASAERVFELLDAPEETPDRPRTAAPPSRPATQQATLLTAGSLTAGSLTAGSLTAGSLTAGSGTAGSGTAGSGTAGSGTQPRRGHVRLRDVSFRYSPTGPLVLENLNLEVAPGQTVAIVGPTGAGKTTLVNLLLRFYETTSGEIMVDGVDVRQLPRDDLRRHFGVVSQDAWLFEGTIRENIAYGAPDAGEAAVLRAARLAQVDRFVHRLPNGYDTVLHENGANISGGERQLVTMARALLIDPSIIVLDEATSCVDPYTEALVRRSSRSLRESRTIFVVAHRLATARDADIILVVDNGQIVEQGRHKELLGLNGRYSDLCASQSPGQVFEQS